MAAEALLQQLYERDGKLTAETVLTEATDPSSELHRYFEWDDAVAAHGYRVDQAHGLIRRYKMWVETAPEQMARVRRYTFVGGGTYVPTEEALVHHRDVVFEQAVKELSAFRRKYEALTDVERVWSEATQRRTRKKAS